jgi:hypothetical protein
LEATFLFIYFQYLIVPLLILFISHRFFFFSSFSIGGYVLGLDLNPLPNPLAFPSEARVDILQQDIYEWNIPVS